MLKIKQIKNIKEEEQVKKLVKLRKRIKIILLLSGFSLAIVLLLSMEIHFSTLDPLTEQTTLNLVISFPLAILFGSLLVGSFLFYNHLNYKLKTKKQQ